VCVMASPVIECPVSGRQRISLNRASLRRKRSMKAAAKAAVNTPAPEKPKPKATKTRSSALQECVKTYFASLNSISRSIVLESEALQKLFGPDWEQMNAKQQEELLNKHFMPSRVKEHYTGDRRSMSPLYCETEPEIDSKPVTTRQSAKKDSVAAPSDDEPCISPKGKVSFCRCKFANCALITADYANRLCTHNSIINLKFDTHCCLVLVFRVFVTFRNHLQLCPEGKKRFVPTPTC